MAGSGDPGKRTNLEETHKIPDGVDVVLHEAAKVGDVLDGLVEGVDGQLLLEGLEAFLEAVDGLVREVLGEGVGDHYSYGCGWESQLAGCLPLPAHPFYGELSARPGRPEITRAVVFALSTAP